MPNCCSREMSEMAYERNVLLSFLPPHPSHPSFLPSPPPCHVLDFGFTTQIKNVSHQ